MSLDSDFKTLIPSLRTQRLRLVWILAIPFFWFAIPTKTSLLWSLPLALLGLVLRGSAAGHIDKDRTLAISGPYARIRHPLYVGSFLIGAGLAAAGGRWVFVPLFVLVFTLVYGRTIRGEDGELVGRFGQEYRDYRKQVPPFLPRWSQPGRGGPDDPARSRKSPFSYGLFAQNREWEAGIGVFLGWSLLWLKMLYWG